MSFEERNASWDGSLRELRQIHSRSSTPRIWTIRVQGNSIITSWGQLGGAMQQATEFMKGVNIGKKNEMTPEQYAVDRAREMCRKRNWEGYREIGLMLNGTPASRDDGTCIFLDEPVKADIDFDNLSLSLCFYKPDNSMGAGITKKAEAGQVLYARKANGMMFVIAKGSQPAKLYSRRMLRNQDDEVGQVDKTWDRRFSNIQAAADLIMPANSIMLGELVVIGRPEGAYGDCPEDFKAIQSLTKCLTDEAFVKLTELENEGKRPIFYCWDIAFWDGQDLVQKSPVGSRYDLIHEVLEGQHLFPVEIYNSTYCPTPESAVLMAKARKWEGCVVVDPEGIYGDKAYNFKGKPDRPGQFCAKLKPEFEDDFIALWDPENGHGERSTKGRSNQGIKSVGLYQHNSKGELVYIANVSSGLKDDQKKNLADPKLFPQVWKVLYTERFYQSQGDDTNALIFPRFEEVRADKKPEECINPEL